MKTKKVILTVISAFLLTTFFGCKQEDCIKTVELRTPTNFKATLSTTEKNVIDFSWDSTGGPFYQICESTTNDNSTAGSIYNGCINENKFSCSFSKSGTYYFWVRSAIDSLDEHDDNFSDFSEVSVITFKAEKLDAPANFKVEPSSTRKNTLDLTWDPTNGAKYYRIYYNTTNDKSTAKIDGYKYFNWCHRKNGEEYDGDYSVSLFTSGTYYFWIRASTAKEWTNNFSGLDGETFSDFSEATCVTFTHEALSAPTNLKVDGIRRMSFIVDLSWDSTSAPYYKIYIATEDDFEKAELWCRSKTNSTNAQVHDGEGTYYIWIKSADDYSDAGSSSDCSPSVSFTYKYWM